MKKNTYFFCALIMLASHVAHAEQQQKFQQQAKMAIQEFATTLKSSLVSAMKSDGPIEAIQVCNQVAPTIAISLSEKYDLTIGRTSLKVRNPSNNPDQWEQSVLKQFEQRNQAGEAINMLSFSEVTDEGDKQQMRMMKAIPTGEVCLTCHGSNIAEPVQMALDELYPADQATGFSLGDIRGAFTVRNVLEK